VEVLVRQETQETLAVPDNPGLKASEDHWGPQEPQGLMERLGILDPWETPDGLDHRDQLEMTVLSDQVDQADRKGSKDRRVHQVLREPLAALDRKDEMDTLERQVQVEALEGPERLDSPEQQDNSDQSVC
jgi:hypothetical protein